jgi:hypothetical protein
MVGDLARCELLADASPEDLWRLADLPTPVSAAAGAQTEVHCLIGGRPAAVRLLGIPGARERVIRLARHRLAANLVPVPLRLLDGATVWLRPVVPEDGNAVLGHRGRSSNETLYRRFFRSGQPSRRDLAYLADADYNARARAMLERAGLRWTPERSGVVHGVAAVPDPSLLGIPRRRPRLSRPWWTRSSCVVADECRPAPSVVRDPTDSVVEKAFRDSGAHGVPGSDGSLKASVT